DDLAERLKYIQNASGAILGPFDCWLTIRGIETLTLRIEKQCANAFRIARFLKDRPEVAEVYYPGLDSHPNHHVALRQQHRFGGVVSFTLVDDSLEAARRFVTQTNLFQLAESLGGVKSLLCHPATMTHASIPAETRHENGLKDSLIRLSCGIEHGVDLLSDLDQAFAAIVREPVLV
ncbi:MAG: PLP-dependent transferase, partial [Bacteroidota bacterium]